MTLTLIGSVSVGAAVPLAATAQAQGSVAVAQALAQAQSQLASATASLAGMAVFPQSIEQMLLSVTTLISQIEATIALGVPLDGVAIAAAIQAIISQIEVALLDLQTLIESGSLPGVSASLTALGALADTLSAMIAAGIPGAFVDLGFMTAIVASAQAIVSGLESSQSALATVSNVLATAGLELWRYDGPLAEFGQEVTGQIGGSVDVTTVVLIARTSEQKAALQATFGI